MPYIIKTQVHRPNTLKRENGRKSFNWHSEHTECLPEYLRSNIIAHFKIKEPGGDGAHL